MLLTRVPANFSEVMSPKRSLLLTWARSSLPADCSVACCDGHGLAEHAAAVLHNVSTHKQHGRIGGLAVGWGWWDVVALRSHLGKAHHHVAVSCVSAVWCTVQAAAGRGVVNGASGSKQAHNRSAGGHKTQQVRLCFESLPLPLLLLLLLLY